MDTNRIILFSVQNIEILLLEIKYYNPIFDFFHENQIFLTWKE